MSRSTAEIVADLRRSMFAESASKNTVLEAADRLAELDEMVNVTLEAELTTYETQLAAVSAAIEQYDTEPHPADPLVLFACVSAVAKALNLSASEVTP